MESYLIDITTWLFLFIILSPINLPLTRKLLPNLADRGWVFSKIIAILLIGYFSWLLGMLKLVPFSQTSIFLLLVILAVINFFVQKNSKKPWFSKLPLKIIILEEVVFSIGFIFWSLVRSHNPDIHDLEKFMDFGFINSILRSNYFPPKDIWLAGSSINYYYFGHLVSALIIKLIGTRAEVGYNLILSWLFSLTLTASFSIGFNLVNRQEKKTGLAIFAGFLTAIFLTLFGNLQVIFAFIKGIGEYWYPDATRFIPNTIHEFPIYSFVVADLHGHLLDVPFVLLTVVFFFSNFFTEAASDENNKDKKEHKGGWESQLPKYVFSGFTLAAMYMTNAADAIIYFGLLAFFTFFRNLSLIRKNRLDPIILTRVIGPLILTITSLIFFSLPFQLTFKPFTEGIRLASEKSPWWMFLTIWSFSLFFALSFIFSYLKRNGEKTLSDYFILFVSLFSIVLIIIPEIIYFKDIYTGQPRANTMFKFTYQAFMLFSIVSAYTIVRIGQNVLEKVSVKGIIWLLIGLNLIEIMSFYPYLAVNSAYGRSLFGNLRGLDGLMYLSETQPEDYQSVKWFNENVVGQPVILEAVGESYTNYARISANTGLPTVLGWPVHEWLWRKDVKITEKRRAEVETIYTSKNIDEAQNLLVNYNVQYIYLGGLEREKYPNLNELQLLSLGEVVYQNGTSKIIKIDYH